MRVEDIAVEVRDVNLERVGLIPEDDLSLSFKVVPRGIGEWQLRLPQEHPMVAHLSTPGSGLLVTDLRDGSVMTSGLTDLSSFDATPDDPQGTLTINGNDDSILLWDKVVYPNPGLPADQQDRAYDVEEGYADVLMRYFVDANLGQDALGARHTSLTAKVDARSDLPHLEGVGTAKVSARFDTLGDIFVTLATAAGLNFRLVQAWREDGDPYLELELWKLRDLTDIVRMDVLNGTLSSQQVQRQAPSVTMALIAGQGEGEDRTIIPFTTAAVREAAQQYGRFIEVFKDQRNTNDADELNQAGTEILDAGGLPVTAVKVVPADDQTMEYGTWLAGDLVGVVVDGQETSAHVTEAAFIVSQDGFTAGAALGDVTAFDTDGTLASQVDSNTGRIGQLERNVAASVSQPPPGTLTLWAGGNLPSGWTNVQGQSIERTSYPALFAAIGTKYGAVDDEHYTLPNVPSPVSNMRYIIKIN